MSCPSRESHSGRPAHIIVAIPTESIISLYLTKCKKEIDDSVECYMCGASRF
jgi:hypothetical protein